MWAYLQDVRGKPEPPSIASEIQMPTRMIEYLIAFAIASLSVPVFLLIMGLSMVLADLQAGSAYVVSPIGQQNATPFKGIGPNHSLNAPSSLNQTALAEEKVALKPKLK